tara:strand:+ start:1363 stop:1521 length:159 start_codon:yes stop_codon:yes gene_type:complete
MIVFVIAVAIYIYSWLSFKPVEKKEVVMEFRKIYVSKNPSSHQDSFSFHLTS